MQPDTSIFDFAGGVYCSAPGQLNAAWQKHTERCQELVRLAVPRAQACVS